MKEPEFELEILIINLKTEIMVMTQFTRVLIMSGSNK